MKKVTLKSITMQNFRGEKERTTKFNDGETTIMGENGSGKSRHFDAFVWLLFGKDTKDRKDFNIKTLVDGKTIDRINTEVSCVLDVDGETINLRRIFKEKWVKPRGEINEVFKGNETETSWNDVPVNVTEYQTRINSIINDSIFKMITNPLFFASMKWQEQRDVLFQLAGTVTDYEIAQQKPEYIALMDKISGKSLADFKREIAARKKKLKDELATIQPRIDQTHKLMPESVDFASLEVEIENLEKQIKDVDEAIADKTKAVRQQYEAVQKKQSEINDLKQKRQQVLHDAKTLSKESSFNANATRRGLESNIGIAENEFAALERSTENLDYELDGLEKLIEEKEKAVIAKREEWHKENAIEYNGGDTCHGCGQKLPEEQRANALQQFADSKQKKLAQITLNGGEINAEIEQLKNKAVEIEKTLKTSQNSLHAKNSEIANLKDELARMPVVNESEINPENLPEYVELSAKIYEMESTIDNGTEKVDTTELQANKKEISTKLDSVKGELKNRDLIAQYKGEITELEAKGKQLSQQIADVEREEYTIQNFTKAKINECESRINGLFSMVTFKLFDYTNDGNESETCVPLVNGIPFGTTNTAGQVNAGLDIINALVRFHGVSAPIFIDGRESVNNLIKTESQIINLVVSYDKNLVIR